MPPSSVTASLTCCIGFSRFAPRPTKASTGMRAIIRMWRETLPDRHWRHHAFASAAAPPRLGTAAPGLAPAPAPSRTAVRQQHLLAGFFVGLLEVFPPFRDLGIDFT